MPRCERGGVRAKQGENNASQQFNRAEVRKNLLLPICRAIDRTENYSGVTVATTLRIRRENKDREQRQSIAKSRHVRAFES